MFKGYKISLIPFLVIFILGFTYTKVATPIYRISAKFILWRSTIPPLDVTTPEPNNRWVWVRDGLSLKESLLSDSFFLNAFAKYPLLQERFKQAPAPGGANEQEGKLNFIHELKKKFTVDYGGGDANTFMVMMEDSDPLLAKQLVEDVVEDARQLRRLMLNETIRKELESLDRQLLDMEGKESSRKSQATRDVPRRKYIEENRAKLQGELSFREAEFLSTFKLLETPVIPKAPFWPSKKLILLLCLLLGSITTLAIRYASLRGMPRN